MKLMIFIFILFGASSSFASPMRLYHVEVFNVFRGEEKSFSHVVRAPSDGIALDAVLIASIYRAHHGKITGAVVKETGLSSFDLPKTLFAVDTEEKRYPMLLGVSDPEFAMTMIQAARHILSKNATREVYDQVRNLKLKSFPFTKYTVKLKNNHLQLLLNTNNPEHARHALEIAVVVSKYRDMLVEVIQTNRSQPVSTGTCKSIFATRY